MVRAPCCDKMRMKNGPWAPEEDQILIAYIQRNGHGNWRALPKQAGLLRCGKSCRLRWTNYLRPDIKRGNFSGEEEEIIIKLHELLGNKWSAIASRLPGRTDNEIKNVWHSHLKKRVKQDQTTPNRAVECDDSVETESKTMNFSDFSNHQIQENPGYIPGSPLQRQSLSSEISSSGTDSSNVTSMAINDEFGGDLWSEVLSTDTPSMPQFFEANATDLVQFPLSPTASGEPICRNGPYIDDGMDFWFNVYMGDGQWPELPEL